MIKELHVYLSGSGCTPVLFLQVVRAVTQAESVAGSVVGVSLTWVRYHVHTDAASCLIIVVLGPMCARTIK